MKVGILAGGYGTRLAEETEIKPKPLVEIGSKPILWHIMKSYSHYGHKDFFIALGYKGEMIKKYFIDYSGLQGNISVDMTSGQVQRSNHPHKEDWNVHLIETGLKTNTGGRIKGFSHSWATKLLCLPGATVYPMSTSTNYLSSINLMVN